MFSPADVGNELTISKEGGLVKVGREVLDEVFWGDEEPPELSRITIVSVNDEWVKYGHGKKDKFRNPRTAGGFIINSTELRAVNFSMVALDTPPAPTSSSGRRAGVVSAPLPKRYTLPKEIDNDIRCACW